MFTGNPKVKDVVYVVMLVSDAKFCRYIMFLVNTFNFIIVSFRYLQLLETTLISNYVTDFSGVLAYKGS